jgi:hypothetical protein
MLKRGGGRDNRRWRSTRCFLVMLVLKSNTCPPLHQSCCSIVQTGVQAYFWPQDLIDAVLVNCVVVEGVPWQALMFPVQNIKIQQQVLHPSTLIPNPTALVSHPSPNTGLAKV